MMDWDKVIAEIKAYHANGDPIKDVLEKHNLTETQVIMHLIGEVEVVIDELVKRAGLPQ